MDSKNVVIVSGDLVRQTTEVIVNAWNRNLIPWWLLLPQGVSGAIKRAAGSAPFRELSRHGVLPLGWAALTSSGRLAYRGIIHVAGINHFWRASEFSIRESVRNAMQIVNAQGFRSVSFPVIGSGSGGYSTERALELMLDEFSRTKADSHVVIVRFGNSEASKKTR